MSQEAVINELIRNKYAAEIIDGMLYINCDPSDENTIVSIRGILASLDYEKTWGCKIIRNKLV